MLLSSVSVLVVAQSSSEIPEGLMNNPVYHLLDILSCVIDCLITLPFNTVGYFSAESVQNFDLHFWV